MELSLWIVLVITAMVGCTVVTNRSKHLKDKPAVAFDEAIRDRELSKSSEELPSNITPGYLDKYTEIPIINLSTVEERFAKGLADPYCEPSPWCRENGFCVVSRGDCTNGTVYKMECCGTMGKCKCCVPNGSSQQRHEVTNRSIQVKDKSVIPSDEADINRKSSKSSELLPSNISNGDLDKNTQIPLFNQSIGEGKNTNTTGPGEPYCVPSPWCRKHGFCVERRRDCINGTMFPGECCGHRGKCKCCVPTLPVITTTIMPTTTTKEPTTTTYCQSQRTTICPDGTRCHRAAICVAVYGFKCKCANGYGGDGYDCGVDTDLDSWPDVDLECCKVNDHCTADNCVYKPNSGQEDYNNNGIGDACGDPPPQATDGPVTNGPFCIPRKPHTKCNLTSDAWRTQDTDGDGHVDSCDNCPHVSNVDQADFDGDRVGDVCDTDQDTDNDGIQDGIDNCIDVYNQGQSDVDFDGLGDVCDEDADDDGILNMDDNCWLVPNPGQEDTDINGFGDACQDDKDGDCLPDHDDVCPKDPKIHSVDFRYFHRMSLDGSSGQAQAEFVILDDGKEITQKWNSKPGLMFGEHTLAGLDFEGTFFIDYNGDDDYAGFVFGYHDSRKFYVVMWKKYDQYYWICDDSYGEAGLALKRVHSSTGPNPCLADALWATHNTTDQVSLLWHDSNKIGWEYDTAYRWELIHRPHIGLIRFRFTTGANVVIADSGNIYDDEIKSGFLGVFCQSQEAITWSNLKYKCNDDTVPQEVYDDLPPEKQAEVTIDPTTTWSGKVKAKKKQKTHIVYYEPGMGYITPQPATQN